MRVMRAVDDEAPGVDRVVPQFFVGAPQTWGARLQYNF